MRRLSGIISALLAAIVLTACTSLGEKDNLDPPTELQPVNTGVSVVQLWQAKVGKGAGRAGVSLRLASLGDQVFAASADGVVMAFNARSGATTWTTRVSSPIGSGPSIVEDKVVVGGLDGSVYVLSASNGSEQWTARVSSEVLATAAGSAEILVIRSQDGRLFGFDATSGQRRWLVDRDTPLLSLRGNSAPVVRDGSVFVGFDTGRVVSLNLVDGAVRWEQSVATGEGRTEIDRMVDIDGDIQVVAGDVYAVAYGSQAVALTADSGRVLWSRDYSAYTGMAVFGTMLYMSTANGEVVGLDRRSGSALWTQSGLMHRGLSAPAAHGNYALVGDFDGYLHWLSSSDGSVEARERLGGSAIRTPPLVVGTTLYVLDTDGRLGAYELRQP